jgi:hypothetical protein
MGDVLAKQHAPAWQDAQAHLHAQAQQLSLALQSPQAKQGARW